MIACVAPRWIASNGRQNPEAMMASFRNEHHTDAALSIFDATVEANSCRATDSGNPRSRLSERVLAQYYPEDPNLRCGRHCRPLPYNGMARSCRWLWFLVSWMHDF